MAITRPRRNRTWAPLTGREINGRDSQLPARTDAQLGEYLSEMPLDRARTEEESSADLCVGQAVAGEPRYVELLEVSSLKVSTFRLGAFAPTSASSRRARSANAATPIVDSMS